jgi:hypothetical protein
MQYALQGLYDVQIGDTFISCDAGGDGVTVASYIITSVYPTFQLQECIPSMREDYGAADISQRFREFLALKLGREAGWDSEILADSLTNFESVNGSRQHDDDYLTWFRLRNISLPQNPVRGTI